MAGREDVPRTVPMLQFLYKLKRGFLRVTGMRTRGVKVLVTNGDGHVLLIRNSYGNTGQFVLPGGGIRPLEAGDAAAIREVREEVGILLAEVRLLAEHASRAEGKRDMILLYHGHAETEPAADSVEVAEAAFFALDALPATVSPATRRRLDEWIGGNFAGGAW